MMPIKDVKSKGALAMIGVLVFAALIVTGCARNLNYSEYGPSISADGRMLVYQTDRIGPDKYKIYVKYKTSTGWTLPIALLFANSPVDDDGGPFITYDQNHLLVSSDKGGGQGGVDIWIAERKGAVWGVAKNFGKPINSAGYDGFATISPDGNTIYFVRQCPDKKGDKENFGIYFAEKVNGKWQEPKRMPAPINTQYSEFGPIILADGRTLLFSSTRPGGFGGYDMYKTEMMDNGRWSDPLNLGNTINSADDDRLASVPASGDIMYSSKKDVKGRYRIVKTSIPVQLRQSSVIGVGGVVSDKNDSDKKLESEIIITDVATGESYEIRSNEGDGKYFIILNRDRNYDVSIRSKGYLYYSTRFDLKGREVNAKYAELIRDIELSPIEKGATFTLNNVYFDFKSSVLKDESRFELDRVVAMLQRNPEMVIEIGGHTDDTGSAPFNVKLSKDRADAVAGYFKKQGISEKRLVTKGYGDKRPVSYGATEKARALNRRVEIKILSHGQTVSYRNSRTNNRM